MHTSIMTVRDAMAYQTRLCNTTSRLVQINKVLGRLDIKEHDFVLFTRGPLSKSRKALPS